MPATAGAGLSDGPPLYHHDLIRAWREAAGWSRTEAAARCGLSYPWYTRLEAGGFYRRNPSLAVLHQVAAAFGHDAGELIAGMGGHR